MSKLPLEANGVILPVSSRKIAVLPSMRHALHTGTVSGPVQVSVDLYLYTWKDANCYLSSFYSRLQSGSHSENVPTNSAQSQLRVALSPCETRGR